MEGPWNQGLECGHAWRDSGSRAQAGGGFSDWGSGILTAALLLVCKAQALVDWPQRQGPGSRYYGTTVAPRLGDR